MATTHSCSFVAHSLTISKITSEVIVMINKVYASLSSDRLEKEDRFYKSGSRTKYLSVEPPTFMSIP